MSAGRLLRTVGLAAALAACGRARSEPVGAGEYGAMPADHVLYDVEHFVTTSGVRRARLLADTGYVYEDSAHVALRNVRLELFDDEGRESATLTSRTGALELRTQAMTARGQVVLVTRDGRRIETAELHFDPQRDRLWSDSATTLREGGTVARGDGFSSDGRLRNLTVTRPRGRVEGLKIEF